MSIIKTTCKECNVEFTGHHNKQFCTIKCRAKYKKREKSLLIKEEDKILCHECGLHFSSKIHSHLTVHNITLEEYKKKYPDAVVFSQKYLSSLSDKMKGEKNPGYHHGGKLSPFSKSFVKYNGMDEKEKTSVISNMARDAQIKSKKKGNLAVTKDYWIKRGYSEQEAEQKQKERQTTFSLDKCIDKFGKEKGTQIWNERQDKWKKTLNSKDPEELDRINRAKLYDGGPISKIEKKLFDHLKEHFSTIERQYCIISNGKRQYFDMKYNNKIIEFNGDYWHCNPSKYDEDHYHTLKKMTAKEIWKKDEEKNNIAISQGFQVLIVWEKDFKENPEREIKKCLTFMKM